MKKLEGQVAIIVGSARGIGEAIAHTFSREGAKMSLADLETARPNLHNVVGSIGSEGGTAMELVVDATDARQVENMVERTIREWGCVDILVNSMGFRGPMVPLHEISEEEWEAVIDVNLKAPFLCCKAVLRKAWRCAGLCAPPSGAFWA